MIEDRSSSSQSFLNMYKFLTSSVREAKSFNLTEIIEADELEQLQRMVQSGNLSLKKWRCESKNQTLLHVAALADAVDVIEYLTSCAHSVNIDAQDKDGNTALHLAVFYGREEACRVLLRSKINVALLNVKNDPALHVALRKCNSDPKMMPIVEEFIGHHSCSKNVMVEGRHKWNGLQVLAGLRNAGLRNVFMFQLFHESLKKQSGSVDHLFVRDMNGANLMHMAARAGSYRIVKFIFEVMSRDPSPPSEEFLTAVANDNKTPLHYSVEGGHYKCAKILLEHGADCTMLIGNRTPPIHRVCIRGDLEMLKMMVEMKGSSVLLALDKDKGTLLHSCAASTCNQNMVTYLVQNGIGVNEVDNVGLTPLANAILLGSEMAVCHLCQVGADPEIADHNGCNALHLSIKTKRLGVFKRVVGSSKAEAMAKWPNKQGLEPLQLALKIGWTEVIDYLLPLSDNYVKDKEGNNLMHHAALSTNERVLVLLLRYPFCHNMINQANHSGLSPLHFSASKENPNIAQLLLEHGAVVQRSKTGLTPFMCACSKGNFETARTLLLADKFQKNWVDHDGNSSLHFAVDGSNSRIIKLCLDEGTAVALNNDGLSFFDKIIDLQNVKLAKVALQHSRWEEILNVVSPYRPHSVVRIVDDIPEVYGVLLDQCFSKSSHVSMHKDYWEEFNFKGVTVIREKHKRKLTAVPENDNYFEMKNRTMHSGSVSEQTKNDFLQTSTSTASNLGCCRRGDERPLHILRKLVEKNYQVYLLHPVVAAFIRTRWNGFSANFYLFKLFFHFLMALLLTIFLIKLPQPKANSMNGNNITYDCLSLSGQERGYLGVIMALCFVNLLFFVEQISHRWHLLLQTFLEGVTWMNFLASVLTIFFLCCLLACKPVQSWWNIAAVAVTFSWLCVGFNLQLINLGNIGIYLTMLMQTSQLVFAVLALMFFLLVAFGIPMYLLIGYGELQFASAELSLFSMLNTLIGITDYSEFIKLLQMKALLFPTTTFLYFVIILVVFPIVMINILIGLAVGNIKNIQKNAIISRREVEVRALSHMDNLYCLQRCFKSFTIAKYKYYPNRRKNICQWITDSLFQFHGENFYAEELRTFSREVTRIVSEEGENHQNQMKQLEKCFDELASHQATHQASTLNRVIQLESSFDSLRNHMK